MNIREPKKDPVLHIPKSFREEDELRQFKDSADITKLRKLLKKDEVVCRLVKCYHEESDAVLAATNKRVIFADQRFITSKVETYDYSEIAAVVYSTQISTQSIVLVHGQRTLTVSKVDREHGERFVKFIAKIIGGDYKIQAKGRVFRHDDDMLRLTDIPSLKNEMKPKK